MAVQQKGIFRVWGTKDWASYYGKPEKLDSRVREVLMSPCPFNRGKIVADTHFAFMGMPDINGDPLTVAKWLELHPVHGQLRFFFNGNLGYISQPYTHVTVLEPCLYLVLREIVPGSTYKTPEEQVKFLPPGYEVPSTITEVTKNILVFRKTGKRCNRSFWAACSERTTARINEGSISCVGFFGESGFILSYWQGGHNDRIGVGASRRLKFSKI